MESTLKPLHALLKLNSRLFINCLEGVDDKAARTRIDKHTNNVAFIASHLVDARYFLAGYLGVEANNPFKETLAGLKSIEEFTEFPLVDQVRTAWGEISQLLVLCFERLSAEELQALSPQSFPLEDPSVLGGIAFLLHHETYHIGQLGFLRKGFELGPMSYAEDRS